MPLIMSQSARSGNLDERIPALSGADRPVRPVHGLRKLGDYTAHVKHGHHHENAGIGARHAQLRQAEPAGSIHHHPRNLSLWITDAQRAQTGREPCSTGLWNRSQMPFGNPALRPVVLQLDCIEPLSGGFRHGGYPRLPPRTCSVATEVNRQFLGQDSHLPDDDAFHGAPKQ